MERSEIDMCEGYPCPCCGYLTRSNAQPGTYEICPICGWEDDFIQYDNPDMPGGANEMSLNEARASFIAIGAISQKYIGDVRPPKECELPKE